MLITSGSLTKSLLNFLSLLAFSPLNTNHKKNCSDKRFVKIKYSLECILVKLQLNFI